MNRSQKTNQSPEPETHEYTLWMLKTGERGPSAEHQDHDLECDCPCSETETGLIPVAGTYDTFKCVDCEIVLSGYKMGDKNLNKHVLRNATTGKRCRYIQKKFQHREVELRTLEGLLRFQEGHVAFPAHVLLAKKQYRMIQGNWHCVLCSQKLGLSHHPACADLADEVTRYMEKTNLISQPAGALLFNSTVAPAVSFGSQWLECDSVGTGGPCAEAASDFSVLGERANMKYVPGTEDRHHCNACGLLLRDFVKGDTLLGEHIYFAYNTGGRCSYIDTMYTRDKILLILGQERFRRGMVAFPACVFKAEYSYCSVAGKNRCVVCTAVGSRDSPASEHKRACAAVSDALAYQLRRLAIPSS